MIVSGRKVTATVLRNAFGLDGDEHLLGFVAVGTPSAEPSPIARPEPGEHLSGWSSASRCESAPKVDPIIGPVKP
jgi:hypothetical protein